MSQLEQIPRSVNLLGWAGVLPFAGLSALVLLDWSASKDTIEPMLIAYGAIILSFMGGVHWGIAMTKTVGKNIPIQPWHLVLSVIPALLGWTATFFDTRYAIAVLAVGFVALLIVDMNWASGNCAPAWYGKLRLQLTSTVLLCLGAVGIS